jgi:hypothetical protein
MVPGLRKKRVIFTFPARFHGRCLKKNNVFNSIRDFVLFFRNNFITEAIPFLSNNKGNALSRMKIFIALFTQSFEVRRLQESSEQFNLPGDAIIAGLITE